MHEYLFQLGHQPQISIAEIEAVFSLLKIKYKIQKEDNQYLFIKTTEAINSKKIMDRLGGTIKIAEKKLETKNLVPDITKYLEKTHPKGKIIYSISGNNAKNTALKIKKELKTKGRSVRYIELKNTATILHNDLIKKQSDLAIINNYVFCTREIQEFEDFTKRDYDRPGSDAKSGMLPPKLARIMINLSKAGEKETILDPFCGSGTILMEALVLNYHNLVGTDSSKKALQNTNENLKWLQEKYDLPANKLNLYQSRAEEIEKQIKKTSIDTIITEPYMGKPLNGKEERMEIIKQAEELKKLYIKSFNSFYKILKPKGKTIFIIPKFRYKDVWIKIDCLDEIKKIGFKIIPFSKEKTSLLYWRKNQHVGREIWQFGKT